MSSQAFCRVAALIFGIVALAHVARLALDLPIQIGAASIPMWTSWFGLLLAGGLSMWGFRSGLR